MAEFSKLVITNKGRALLAKMIAGSGNIEFTKVSASSTTYTDEQLEGLTSLSNVNQTSLISKVTRTNEVAIKVETTFTNAELTVGYYMKALGLYAVDPDEGEILYAVTRETSGNCYMPAYNGVTVSGAYVQLVTAVGNAENVSLEVDQAAVATIGDVQELQKRIADLEAFIGYPDYDDIYGVEVDFANKKFTRLSGAVNRTPGAGFDSINAFGGRKRCNVKDDGTVTAYYGDSDYTTTGKNRKGEEVQVMVEQPKFYYRVVPMVLERGVRGMKIRKARYYVSDTLKPGFKLHPAFIENGNTNPYIYLAAFEGSIYDVSEKVYVLDGDITADISADKFSSIAEAKPFSGLSRASIRSLAKNRGLGWEQAYAATVAASQILILIEYASFDIQSCIGRGVTEKHSPDTSSVAEPTGATMELGDASGMVLNSDGIEFVSYRGEENLWGNLFAWVDGMNEENSSTFTIGDVGTLYVADHGFADAIKVNPYKNTGIHPCYGRGYASAFGYSEEFDWMFVPVEYDGNNLLPVSDYVENSSRDWSTVAHGGDWGSHDSAGAYCYSYIAQHIIYSNYVGGRLVYVQSKKL